MYRKHSGNAKRPLGTPEAAPFASGGFAGGIFSEHTASGRPEDYLNVDVADATDEVFDHIEEGVRPENLLRADDQEALALGRSVLGVARAVGGIVRAATTTGRVVAGDVNRHGLRGAMVEGLRRMADRLDPRPVQDEGLYMQEAPAWPEDQYTARPTHDPRDPHWNFRREYVRPEPSQRPQPEPPRWQERAGVTTVREEPTWWQERTTSHEEPGPSADDLDERAPGDDRPPMADELFDGEDLDS